MTRVTVPRFGPKRVVSATMMGKTAFPRLSGCSTPAGQDAIQCTHTVVIGGEGRVMRPCLPAFGDASALITRPRARDGRTVVVSLCARHRPAEHQRWQRTPLESLSRPPTPHPPPPPQ